MKYKQNQLLLVMVLKNVKIPNKESFNLKVLLQNYKNYNLPISMNPNDYRRIIIQNKLNYVIQNNQEETINLTKFDTYNEVEFLKSGISLIKYKDIFINDDKFLREIDNKSFLFEKGIEILFQSKMKSKFINKLKNLKIQLINL